MFRTLSVLKAPCVKFMQNFISISGHAPHTHDIPAAYKCSSLTPLALGLNAEIGGPHQIRRTSIVSIGIMKVRLTQQKAGHTKRQDFIWIPEALRMVKCLPNADAGQSEGCYVSH